MLNPHNRRNNIQGKLGQSKSTSPIQLPEADTSLVPSSGLEKKLAVNVGRRNLHDGGSCSSSCLLAGGIEWKMVRHRNELCWCVGQNRETNKTKEDTRLSVSLPFLRQIEIWFDVLQKRVRDLKKTSLIDMTNVLSRPETGSYCFLLFN